MYEKEENTHTIKNKILYAASKMFLSIGYDKTTLLEIAKEANLNIDVIVDIYKSKENIIYDLVCYVLNGQFEFTEKLLQDKTDDKILFYAVETTLQLYMAESDENIRKLYNVAYSLPDSLKFIYDTISEKIEKIFKNIVPDWKTKDFYEREIASAGVIKNFMLVPCDMYFTIERKAVLFLKATLLLYHVSQEKIQEAIDFISQFDFDTLTKQVINDMFSYLEENK